MKKDISNQTKNIDNDMLPEYYFKNMAGGIQGKYYKDYREGHTVKIHNIDGTTTVQHFTLEENTVILDPDVQEYFPDSEAVNEALRCLIPLLAKNVREAEKLTFQK
ncbi:MAG TPA: hypothetical protein VJL89_02135 [Thermodesulfovibrionia bacterium]|nr:hypothetical protein [Thermodesulfovibrionia bacterium]